MYTVYNIYTHQSVSIATVDHLSIYVFTNTCLLLTMQFVLYNIIIMVDIKNVHIIIYKYYVIYGLYYLEFC